MAPCTVKWCGKNSKSSNSLTDGITFHRYPKEPELKQKWINATRRENWSPSAYSIICSRHFSQDCFVEMKNRRRLVSSAVPTLFLPLLSGMIEPNSVMAALFNPEPITPNISYYGQLNTQENEEEKEAVQSFAESNQSKQNVQTELSEFCLKPNSETANSIKENVTGSNTHIRCNSPTKQHLCRRIAELTEILAHKNKRIKTLRQKTSYLKKRLTTLKSVLKKSQRSYF